jgi:hypothetical protein
MVSRLPIRLLALVMAVTTGTAHAQQFRCDESSHDPWMASWVARDGAVPVPRSSIVEIDPATMTEAVALLQTREAVELQPTQLTHFLKADPARQPPEGLKPYLFRAVYPVSRTFLSASWFGNLLQITSGGLGCAPFLKHPVVVYLDQLPEKVDVQASAGL